jgi:hypothetical protein
MWCIKRKKLHKLVMMLLKETEHAGYKLKMTTWHETNLTPLIE